MIAPNAVTTTLDRLRHVPVPTPDQRDACRPAGNYWKGVRHWDLLDWVGKAATGHRLHPTDHRIILWYGDTKMHAAVKLREHSPGVEHWLGVAASNNGDRGLVWYAGQVLHGVPVVYDRWPGPKYTLGFEVPQEAERVLSIWLANETEGDRWVGLLKRTRLPESNYYPVLVEVGRDEILPWTKVGRLDTFWQQGAGKTLWDFHAAAAKAMALTSGPEQMDNLFGLKRVLERYLESQKERVR